MSVISENWQATIARTQRAIHAAGRDSSSVKVMAVSKTFPLAYIMEAASAGAQAFGENYVQEGVEKICAARALGLFHLEWHFIGPLQSNKTRLVAEHFDWVHSVDRLKTAERLSAQRPAHLTDLQVCLQVNISGEASKGGVSPSDTVSLAQSVARLPHLKLRGLMAIPRPTHDAKAQHAAFAETREILERCQAVGLEVDTLSMGMSADLEAAIAEGATIVRVGTAIFGARAGRTS